MYFSHKILPQKSGPKGQETLEQLEVQNDGLIFIFAKNYRKNCRFPCICFCGYCCRLGFIFLFCFFFLLDGIGNANYRRPGTLAIWPYPAPLAAMFLLLGRKEKSGFSFTCPTQCWTSLIFATIFLSPPDFDVFLPIGLPVPIPFRQVILNLKIIKCDRK